jgi:hypothetical protein
VVSRPSRDSPAGRCRVRSDWPWFPTLLAVAYVLEPYASFDFEPASGGRLVLLALAIGLGTTAVCRRLLGPDRGAIAAGILVMALISATTIDRLLVFGAALLLIGTEWAWARRGTLRIRIPWPRLTAGLNAILLVVVVMQIGRGVWLRVSEPAIAMSPDWSVSSVADSPDIFVILADAHGRGDVLMQGYGYDMGALRRSLTADGFDEATQSYANHSGTRLSLMTFLGGRPLVEPGTGASELTRPLDQDSLKDSGGIHLLRSAGYEMTVIASGVEFLGLRDIGRYIDVGPINEMEQVVLSGTALGSMVDGATDISIAGTRTRTLDEIEALKAIAREPHSNPQFVFTHLPAPHWPFVLDTDCSLRPADQYTWGARGRGYRIGDQASILVAARQTECVDHLLADAAHEIVRARPGAIVIVASDHGPDERLDWSAPVEPGLHDRMANLFWARTPGHEGLFPEAVTLVNVLPILFDAYFGTNLAVHSNDLYFGPFEGRFLPYEPPDR